MNEEHVTAIKWVIEAIPLGKVATYGQIAEMAGLPRRARLVARVLRESGDHDGLPWHRVIRSDGRIAPRIGAAKQADLLQREGICVINGRVNLKNYQWLE